MDTSPLLDEAALRKLVGSKSDWAKGCGLRMRTLRKARGFSPVQLAEITGVTQPTINRIETGEIIPRDHLRAAIAYALSVEITDVWEPVTRKRIGEMAAA